MEIDKSIITAFMDKILPAAMNAKNTEQNIRLFVNHELEKFYLDAFADGQSNVLKATLEAERMQSIIENKELQ